MRFIEFFVKIYFIFIEYHIWYIGISWLICDHENMENKIFIQILQINFPQKLNVSYFKRTF